MEMNEAQTQARALGFRGGGTAVGQLAQLSEAVRDGAEELPENWAAIAYGLVQATRRTADTYEAWLIRTLREGGPEGEPMTWAAVAEAVDSHLGSRQAAQAKWKRLIDANRREYGGPGRGGRPKMTKATPGPDLNRMWPDLDPVQAEGEACVVCGRSTAEPGWQGQPVGRSATGSQVFACVDACVNLTLTETTEAQS